jgi:hypothetical protein
MPSTRGPGPRVGHLSLSVSITAMVSDEGRVSEGGDRQKAPGEFQYSEAAMDQWRASKRRAIRPVLVFLPALFLAGVLHDREAVAVTLTLVGMVVYFVMIGQNFVIVRRAERRLKAEKQSWETKNVRPS